MKQLIITGSMLVFAVLPLADAHAQNIKQQEKIAYWQPQINDAVNVLNHNCGSHVTATIDWASFASQEWTQEHSPGYWCKIPLDSIQFQCQTSAPFKNAFAGKVMTYTCNAGTQGHESFGFLQGNFTYSIGWTSNVGQKAVQFLENHL